jgi:hypothetical protein
MLWFYSHGPHENVKWFRLSDVDCLPQRPVFNPGSIHWDSWRTKWHQNRFFPEHSVRRPILHTLIHLFYSLTRRKKERSLFGNQTALYRFFFFFTFSRSLEVKGIRLSPSTECGKRKCKDFWSSSKEYAGRSVENSITVYFKDTYCEEVKTIQFYINRNHKPHFYSYFDIFC